MPERSTRVQLASLASTLGRARVLRLIAVALAWALLPVASLAVSHVVLGVPTRGGLLAVAIASSVFAVALPWLRGARMRVTPLDAALWAERLEPRLQYTLVTIAEADEPVAARLEPVVRAVPWIGPASAQARSRLVRAATLLAASVAGFTAALWPWRAHPEAAAVILGDAPRPGPVGVLAPGAVALVARLVPPAYTGAAERTIRLDGTVHEAIEGTRLELSATSGASRVAITVREAGDSADGGRVALDRAGESWRAAVRVGAVPVAVRVADGVADRWVTIAARPDSVPEVVLEAPDADIVTRDTTATIPIRGIARDDIGLREARVEYILTTGGGEQFAAKTGVLGARRGALGRELAVGAPLSLGALGVKPGDVLHVRVVARDGNTVRGAQLGTSDTRVIRIPREDEDDSVAVEALPPSPVDTSVVSQRMLLVLAEKLVARMRSMPRAAVVEESRRIGQQQGRLRRQVGAVVFMRTGDNPTGEHAHFAGDGHDHTAGELANQPRTPESVLAAAERATAVNAALDDHGDEEPIVAVNRPLLEAYNHMWDATRALESVEPAAAIGPMKRALAAIQRARAAERLYLRGAPPAVLVDVAKLRLTGTDSATFDPRTPLDPIPDAVGTLAARLDRALTTLPRDAGAARDSLRLLRLDALVARPPLARALDEALRALADGRGDAATEALRRARRLAAPQGGGAASPFWSGGAP